MSTLTDRKVIAKEFTTTAICELQDDGTWKAISTIKERELSEGSDQWYEEKVDAMAYGNDIVSAMQVASSSTLNFLLQTVYPSGFDSIIDYALYKKALAHGQTKGN